MKRSSTPARSTTRSRLAASALVAHLALALLGAPATGRAQAPPEGADVEVPFACPAPDEPLPPPDSEEEARERALRERYRELFPLYVAAAGPDVDQRLVVPVEGLRVAQIADTWGGPRDGGRSAEGQDLFAPTGTPVRSATDGWIWRIGERTRGGLTVTVVGGGGRRYYYAHLSDYAEIYEGQRVTPQTVIGYVGATGNARSTPPHLHLGVYESQDPDDPCGWDAIDPLPLLIDRE